MRSATTGINPAASGLMPQDELLTVFRRLCNSRYFDLEVVKASEAGRITYPVYLSLGQEAVSAALSLVMPRAQLFTQHRCHAYFLAFGGTPEKLRDELLGLPGGTSGGRAGSNCLQNHTETLTMFGHHGLIGENVPQAVGAALGSGRQTLCVFGDGAAEEDYIYPSFGFAVTHKLPVLFVCEDNDLSILTPTSTRRSWNLVDMAASLGMRALEMTDDPWTIAAVVRELEGNFPALLNVHVCRRNWHVGVGTDGPMEWDRFETVKQQVSAAGLAEELVRIESEEQAAMEILWAQ